MQEAPWADCSVSGGATRAVDLQGGQSGTRSAFSFKTYKLCTALHLRQTAVRCSSSTRTGSGTSHVCALCGCRLDALTVSSQGLLRAVYTLMLTAMSLWALAAFGVLGRQALPVLRANCPALSGSSVQQGKQGCRGKLLAAAWATRQQWAGLFVQGKGWRRHINGP